MPPAKKVKTEAAPIIPAVVWQRLGDDGKMWDTIAAPAVLESAFASKLPSIATTEMTFAKGMLLTYDLVKLTETDATTSVTRPIRRLVPGVWEWKDDSGLFVAFYDDDSAMIESCWRVMPFGEDGKFSTSKLSFNVGFDSKYTFTLQTVVKNGEIQGLQVNEDSGTKRELRRSSADVAMAVWDTKDFGIAAKKLPTIPVLQDEPAGLARASSFAANVMAPPDTWEPQTKPLEFFDVKPGTAEYKGVVDPFMKTLKIPTATIISVRRIQNQTLWQFYALTRYMVGQRNKGDPKEIDQLYHGCRVRQNLDSIIEFGFDMRVARDGLAGLGIYFALNAQYSNSGYVLQNPDKSKEMLVCRVAVGSHTMGKHGMKRPPAKKNGELYDSVARLPVMHVVFDNSQAYPEYLIKYSH